MTSFERHRSSLDAMIRRLERLALGLDPNMPFIDADKQKKGEYEYIPLNIEGFLSELGALAERPDVKDNRKLTFCEVGCGLATKIWLASCILPHETKFTGIEITPAYLKAAKKFLKGELGFGKHKRVDLIEADAREHDYSPYDIIYFYSPMIHRQGGELVLEQRIADTCKKGAYVIAYMPAHHWYEDKRFNRLVNSDVWQRL